MLHLEALKYCCTSEASNIPVIVVAGAGRAIVTGTVVIIGSIISIPLAPYFWYKSISSGIDAKIYGILEEEFGSIAFQMGLVDEHLEKITTSLHEIEQNLELSERAERKAIVTLDEKKKK